MAIEPGELTLFSEATCTLSKAATDPDGDPITHRFGWQLNGEVLETTEQIVTVSALKSADETPVSDGDTLLCTAVANDGTQDGPVAQSAALSIGPTDVCGQEKPPCSEHAKCTNTGTLVAQCECNTGYTGDGKNCEAVYGKLTLDSVDRAAIGACVPVSIGMVGNDDLPTAPKSDLELEIDTSGAELFKDIDCISPSSNSVILGAGELSIERFVMVTAAGAQKVTVQADGYGALELSVLVAADSFGVDLRAERTLVVYNQNSPGALEIAEYYMAARAVPASQLCGVKTSQGTYAAPKELMGARRTIIESCFCSILEDAAPANCGVETLPEILEKLPITFIAMIRGFPARLANTGWDDNGEDPGFDYYLSYMLAHTGNVFADTDKGGVNIEYANIGAKGDSAPPIAPGKHGYFAISRVEAMTVDRTKALIDRTLESEKVGLQGNVVSENKPAESQFTNPGRYLMSAFEPECLDYLKYEPFVFGAPESSWDYSQCRWGTTGSSAQNTKVGMMPGFSSTTVPWAVNVQLFIGADPRIDQQPINNHSAFTNYATMKRWRKTDTGCKAECSQLSGDEAKAACVAKSTDYFNALNTDCVGFALGFLGQQLRSYPVQFYGFLPPGWGGAGGGNLERVPGTIITSGGVQTGDFKDGSFVRFGNASPGNPNTDQCVDADGQSFDCLERLPINIQRNLLLSEVLQVDGERQFLVRVRTRNQGSTSGKLRVRLRPNSTQTDLKRADGTYGEVDFSADNDDWVTTENTLIAKESDFTEIKRLTVWLHASFGSKVYGFVDLDAIEVIDIESGKLLYTDAPMAFAQLAPTKTFAGAFASDVIDRMGGIAFWGSSSHHLTGGFAFRPNTAVSTMMHGRTLGESLAVSGAKSGIIYGDPLYRAFAVRIGHTHDNYFWFPRANKIWPDDPPEEKMVAILVLQGTDSTHKVRWHVSTCEEQTVEACNGQWTVALHGVGAARNLMLSYEELQAMASSEKTILRLRAWRPDQPGNHLSSYHQIELKSAPFEEPPKCVYDTNENGIINNTDLHVIKPYTPCNAEKLVYDLNDDGVVSNKDSQVVMGAAKDDPPEYDYNGDGVVNFADANFVKDYYCGFKSNGPAEYDANNDGVIDDADIALIEEYLGFDECVCKTAFELMCQGNI